MTTPSQTPNVVIENPTARKVARTVLDGIGVLVGTIVVVDLASEAFDWVTYTTPVLAAWSYLRLAFGLGIDNRNTPKE